jgi:hypothetical protein
MSVPATMLAVVSACTIRAVVKIGTTEETKVMASVQIPKLCSWRCAVACR